jgi:hypothetical protein
MRYLVLALASFAGVLVGGGCGGVAPNDGLGNATVFCATAAGLGHECITYTGAVDGEDCIGKMTVNSCPPGIGTCALTEGAGGVSVTTATTYYSDSGSSAANEQAACTDIGGVWSN